MAQDAYSNEAIGRFLNGLTTYTPVKEEVVPALHCSLEISEDRKHITIYLRREVHWSAGEPFTAEDVIFAFKALFDERYPNRYQSSTSVPSLGLLPQFGLARLDSYCRLIGFVDHDSKLQRLKEAPRAHL